MGLQLIDSVIENNLVDVKARWFPKITDDIFTIACNNGSFDVALFLFEKNNKLKLLSLDPKLQTFIWITTLPLQNNERIFENDKIFHTAQWVKKIFPEIKLDISPEQSYIYLLENHIDIAVWINIYKLNPEISKMTFIDISYRNKSDLVKIIMEIQPNITNKIDVNDFFIDLCSVGALDVVKLIYQKNKNIDISTKNNYALFLAHKNKHSNVVNWLKSLIV